jgi:hypothetical protein
MRPPLSFAEFVVEMDEVLREARETCAVDHRGRNIELYYGDMMRRLQSAVDLVNSRITARGGLTFAEHQAALADQPSKRKCR